jgi:hypothetical protein
LKETGINIAILQYNEFSKKKVRWNFIKGSILK